MQDTVIRFTIHLHIAQRNYVYNPALLFPTGCLGKAIVGFKLDIKQIDNSTLFFIRIQDFDVCCHTTYIFTGSENILKGNM